MRERSGAKCVVNIRTRRPRYKCTELLALRNCQRPNGWRPQHNSNRANGRLLQNPLTVTSALGVASVEAGAKKHGLSSTPSFFIL